ncbi:MAG: orotidine-5'-phosphate decarboxylase [Syntrophobacteraceae bacterium]|nr:orotidine-5'-phosphate decarboxylase [Syntrophobacteraceae bacterium]
MQPKTIPLDQRIIFALDVDSVEQAKTLVKRLESHIHFYKVGLQLFLAAGFAIVEWIAGRGHKVMLDLKFYDIPQTVKLAVGQLGGKGVTFTTVHGNGPIVKAAVEAAAEEVKILAVTVLTSFSNEDMGQFFGYRGRVEDLVLDRACMAIACGAGGIVASGAEAPRLRSELGDDCLIVTPGIRPAGAEAGDQKRVVTAGQAIGGGADYVVVGRPVRDAAEPLAVIEAMRQEIASSLSRLH